MERAITSAGSPVALLESARRLDRRMSDTVDGAVEDLALTSSLYLVLEALDAEPLVHASQLVLTPLRSELRVDDLDRLLDLMQQVVQPWWFG